MQSDPSLVKMPTLHVIAQSHIDLAWLWQWEPETTHVCCKLTFGQAVKNLESYPDYYFSQSQVPLYEATEKYHPEIFAQIQKFIAEGRWEIVGGMYVEAEGGEPSGESLVRQCIHGKRYFQQKFGIDVKTGWQEDSWSHPWQLPQIYSKCGITSYFWKRGKKSPQMFWWQSPDGSKILAIKPPHLLAGNHRFFDRFILWSWIRKNRTQYHSQNMMIRIGKGDHGGGPKQKEIDSVHHFAQTHPQSLHVQFSQFQQFADAVLDQDLHLLTVNDEIGNELQGDLTNCCEIKQRNRELESLILSTEKWNTIASIFGFIQHATSSLYIAWNKLLFNQFHDIIGGSGIPAACQDAFNDYNTVENLVLNALHSSLDSICAQINTLTTESHGVPLVLFNSLSWERTECIKTIVNFPENPQSLYLLDYHGHSSPVQILSAKKVQDSWQIEILFAATLPTFGYHVDYLFNHVESHPLADMKITTTSLENKYYQIRVDPRSGNIAQIYDKENHRELIDSHKMANNLLAIEDYGDSEGKFNIKYDYAPKPLGKARAILLCSEMHPNSQFEIIENGPLRIGLRIHKKFQQSTFIQDIFLMIHSRRIDFHLMIDWHDIHTMLKLEFPIALKTPMITYHTPYGSITHKGDGIEYPVLQWVDLSSSEYGVGFFNRTRNGCSVNQNVIRLSVLRSPTKPANNNEEGIHHLDYALYPHDGKWDDALIMQRANEFNTPILIKQTNLHNGKLPASKSFLHMHPENVILEAVKYAYDSDEIIFRFYETEGKTTMLELQFPFEMDLISKVNLLEKKEETREINSNVVEWQISPFEILTLAIHVSKVPL